MNEKWEDIFPLTNLRKNPRLMSDHNPLLLGTEQNTVKKTISSSVLKLPG
jgi:hypothetical protein